jgi:multisubunit Na+/H+ antiporter MnhB subunit
MTSRSVVLERSARLLVPPILMTSLYLLFAGHNAPGGGFVGGLSAGLAIALAAAAEGAHGMRRTTVVSPATLLGAGLVIVGMTGALGWVLGSGFLDAGARTFDLPVIGEIKVTSALAFDIGVYCVVAGMVAMVLQALDSTEENGA